VQAKLIAEGHQIAEQLLDSHRRVRGAAKAGIAGLKVTVQDRPDVLGVYVYRPVAAAEENGGGSR
jgi:hypothetical protein